MNMIRPFTVATLADRWSCSASMIRKMLGDGRLQKIAGLGTLVRIAATEVNRFENSLTASSDFAGDGPSSLPTPAQPAGDAAFVSLPQIGPAPTLKRARGGVAPNVLAGPWVPSSPPISMTANAPE